MAELISAIVTTFNRPDALDAALRALSRQTDRDFEVVIADDGSDGATKSLIESRKDALGVKLRHVWHGHSGFRAGEIRNKAILASEGEYCVFLDGDCLARPDFIEKHRRLAEPGWFVVGNRVLLSPQFTDRALREGIAPEQWGFPRLAAERVRGGVNRVLPAARLPLGGWRKLGSRSWIGARTCNLAVHKQDLERIDGFDTHYAGWGLEDSDLVVRLINAGVRRKDGRFATGVLHLWHPEASRSALIDNQHRLDETLRSARVRAERGLSHLAGAS